MTFSRVYIQLSVEAETTLSPRVLLGDFSAATRREKGIGPMEQPTNQDDHLQVPRLLGGGLLLSRVLGAVGDQEGD